MTPREKITALRSLMQAHHLDAYIIPSSDPHQSEYVASRWQARAWMSGFNGSAGTLVVLSNSAGLWADPRYHIRAQNELHGSGIEPHKLGRRGVLPFDEWLAQNLPAGAVVGFDGNVFSAAEVTKLAHAFGDKPVTFTGEYDLVGQIWNDRPAPPQSPIFIHDPEFAGESRLEKISRIRSELAAHHAGATLVSALDNIAWTLNIRGGDVAFNPVALAYLYIGMDSVCLFMDDTKIPASVAHALREDGIQIYPYAEILSFVSDLSPQFVVLIDPDKTGFSLARALSQACHTVHAPNIPARLQAQKNTTEQAGLRASHIRDGVAVVKFLAWLSGQTFDDHHTELTLADKLTEFRAEGEHFHGLSFKSIVGYQANSAVGHYSADPHTTPRIQRTGILLVDSGGQYLDGTTDITRTVTLGDPTPEQKRVYTTVLRSLIRLSECRFPYGTQGNQLDMVARAVLWRQGWQCRHGIGHGVGYFLNVHEGPQRFSQTDTTVIEPGMVTSNEPGVYFEGRFGVRLENVLLSVPDSETEFGEFLAFETLTLCPFDLALIEPSLLTTAEIEWLNAYHQRVFDALSPMLPPTGKDWLTQATRPIQKAHAP